MSEHQVLISGDSMADVEETVKRIQSQKGVQGVIVMDQSGSLFSAQTAVACITCSDGRMVFVLSKLLLFLPSNHSLFRTRNSFYAG